MTEQQVKHCPNCGETIFANLEVCPYCGKTASGAKLAASRKEREQASAVPVLTLVVLVIIALELVVLISAVGRLAQGL
jgi:ribosomal protein L32